MGVAAVEALARGEYGVLVGLHGHDIRTTPYTQVVGVKKPLDLGLVELANVLAM
jgi:6-phosphofructokinase 1